MSENELKQMLGAILNAVQVNTAEIQALKVQVNRLEDRVTRVEQAIERLDQRMTSMEHKMDLIVDIVRTHDNDIQMLKQKVC